MAFDPLQWVVAWLSGMRVGHSTPGPVSTRMGYRLWADKPSRYVTSHPGQPSLLSLRGRLGKSSTSLNWLGLRRGVFACVGWQVILCDPIWQATPRSSEMDFHQEHISLLFYQS